MGSAPALCWGSLLCTAIVLGGRSAAAGCTLSRCSRPAASEQCPGGPDRAGATGRAGQAGWGASPRRGRGLGWTRPERGVGSCPAPPAAPPRAAGGAKARSGDARVCGESAGPGGAGQGPQAGSEDGGLCAGMGALRSPGVETNLGRVALDGSERVPAGVPKAAAVPATLALQSPFPGDPRLNTVFVQRPPGLVSPFKGGRRSSTLALPHPSAAGVPFQPPRRGEAQPPALGTRSRMSMHWAGAPVGIPGDGKPPLEPSAPRVLHTQGAPSGSLGG